MKTNCAILIPIYKQSIDKFEEKSFRQCLNILSKYPIYIITHKKLNTKLYNDIASEYEKYLHYEYFDEVFFQNIQGYNRLMLNIDFYNRFKSNKYILIYQLDAYVFKDELDYWCQQSYDYIGAPWFERYSSHEKNALLWDVGNGGFSLRRVQYFIKVLKWKLPVKKINLKDLLCHFSIGKLLYIFGYYNTMKYHIETNQINEDAFYTQFLKRSWITPKVPDVITAAHFSFEQSPSYLFKLCNNQLPFGCHGFLKYEYDTFWYHYI